MKSPNALHGSDPDFDETADIIMDPVTQIDGI